MREGSTGVEVDSANEAKSQNGQCRMVDSAVGVILRLSGESEERAQTRDMDVLDATSATLEPTES
jgi:hypothetical protein